MQLVGAGGNKSGREIKRPRFTSEAEINLRRLITHYWIIADIILLQFVV